MTTRAGARSWAVALGLAGLAAAAVVVVMLPARRGPPRPPTLRNLHVAPASTALTDPLVNSFVLTSPNGVKVFLDVVSVPPDLEPALRDPASILLVTHRHPDHYARDLVERFAGKKLVMQPGTLESGDVRVTVIPSSNDGDEPDGTDHLLVVDLGGVRVVHLGDCGQGAFSAGQREQLGRVDVLVGALEDPFADELRKGFRLMAQLSPTIVIPTHMFSTEGVGLLRPSYAPVATEQSELVLSPALLAAGRRAIFMGGDLPLARRAGVPIAKDL